jgi:hypothetical protein
MGPAPLTPLLPAHRQGSRRVANRPALLPTSRSYLDQRAPQRSSTRRLLPSVHPSFASAARNAASQDCADGSLSAKPISTPIRRTCAGCCACAASGHATTVLLKSLMNSRRLMASPAPRTKSGIKDYHIFGSRIVPFVAPKRDRNHVRFGSEADILQCPSDVRFTPESRHGSGRLQCPLWPKQTLAVIPINSPAWARNVGVG